MRLSLRFLVPLLFMLTLLAYALLPLVDRLTLGWFQRDLDLRSRVISETLYDSLLPLIHTSNTQKIMDLFNRVSRDERMMALGYCDSHLTLTYRTSDLPSEIDCRSLAGQSSGHGSIMESKNAVLHVYSTIVEEGANVLGYLVIVHDMSFIKRRSHETKWYIFYFFLVLGTCVSLMTVVIAQMSWKGWVAGIEAILRGEGLFRPLTRRNPELTPILKELKSLVRDLESDKHRQDDSQITWTAQTLKEILRQKLAGDEILIVSNREPYIHSRKADGIEIHFPASGLVSALEPIMRACSGTWIAHGSGSADRDVVDSLDHVSAPPSNPSYQIRRVWLTPEQEKGYYYGFANEGLWPLCHIAHARPIFRSSDWEHYVQVNELFSQATIEETKSNDPVILVQDYHFAMLPKVIRDRLPKATLITFWHIPWPNPEAFGICPWREEILSGLLGSTVIGFHTRFHCNNFLDTIDRFLECRIDREASTVSYHGKITAIRQYPISIEWPPKWTEQTPDSDTCSKNIRQRHGLHHNARIGIGVDRLDYTKGIPEKLMAVDRLLELYPKWIGQFFFIQIAAPSRSQISQYQSFYKEVESLAATINDKYARYQYQPIVLLLQHHEPKQVFEYFRGASVCFVNSLHDGMNLVAKEFVASRDDENGVLILSTFTGASRELPEALIVNPYNIDQCAEALNAALEMPIGEQRERIRSMRGLIREFNVFRWAGRMIGDAARIRTRNRLFDRMNDWDFPGRPL